MKQLSGLVCGFSTSSSELQIGPIPADDGVGKEITTRITSAMMTNKTFFTDSNGRDFIKRVCQVLCMPFLQICDVKFSYYFNMVNVFM